MLQGLDRTSTNQAMENLSQALRVLEIVERDPNVPTFKELCPSPLIVIRAEIENARRYLAIGVSEHQAT